MSNQLQAMAQLAKIVSYNPQTGLFKWKVGGRNRVVGQPAGSQNAAGYLRLTATVNHSRIDVMLHRLAVYIMAAEKKCPSITPNMRVKLAGERTDLRCSNIQIFFTEQEEKGLQQPKDIA